MFTQVAFKAIQQMSNAPADALRLLRRRLQPVRAPDRVQITGWITSLDDPHFAVRERATHDLRHLGELAAPALRRAFSGSRSLESRRRIQHLLHELDTWTPARLRVRRAIETLEAIANAGAAFLLAKLAGGSPEAHLTRQARAALERLRRRSPK
jgi:hypothetical protein